MDVYGVIMAGGGGTRFWPLSRHKEPKQRLNLTGKDLMINETIDRVATVADPDHIYIVTNVDQAPKMKEATAGRIDPSRILSEPSARNTAACVGYAAMEILKKHGDGIMAIFPADHYIRNEAEFTRVLKLAAVEAEKKGDLVTLGIRPTFPSTGYGYIKFDARDRGEVKKAEEFKEKPDLETAKSYLESGCYAWNSGMFVWKASVILEHFKTLLPEVYSCLERIGDAMNTPAEETVIEEVYPQIPSVSVDYGIMEKSSDIRVISADFGWDDVGSWENLGVLYDEDDDGNIFAGKHLAIDTKSCITYSKKRLIATCGVENLIIVETDDAVMVIDRSRAQDVKLFEKALRENGMEEYL